MNIAVRVDSSVAIGTGHVMRCRALATELRDRGAAIHFITRALPGHLGDLLERDGFRVSMLPELLAAKDDADNGHTKLSFYQNEDAIQTIAAISKHECNWLVIDHYALDQNWETQLRFSGRKILVIDDLADRPHNCDMLLDQNYAQCALSRYQQLVPAHTQLLLGPRYSLLRREFAELRKTMPSRSALIQRVLVFMGGADNVGIVGKILTALSSLRLAHLDVDLILDSNSLHNDSITKQAAKRSNTYIYGPQQHLADFMAKADLSIGAGGVTMWERMCMGLPSLVISTAENQLPACKSLEAAGLIVYLGSAINLDSKAIEASLFGILQENRRIMALAAANQCLVDGNGAKRVAELLYPTARNQLTLRKATADDELTFYDWVNDPTVRRSALNSEPISLDAHAKWFKARLLDPASHLFVLMAGNLPVGQVRFQREGNEFTISYSLDTLARGRGWAKHLLKTAICALDSAPSDKLKAVVKFCNQKSAKILVSLGFEEQPNEQDDSVRVFRATLHKILNHC